MKKRLIRLAVITLCMVLTISMTVVLPGGSAAAKTKKTNMPSSIKVQFVLDGKWKTEYTLKYKYNKKGDLVGADFISAYPEDVPFDPFIVKYTYKSGKKATATAKEGKDITKIKYDKKGRMAKFKDTQYYTEDLEDDEGYYDSYEYTVIENGKCTYNKKGNLKTVKITSGKESSTIKYTTTYSKKGKVKKIKAVLSNGDKKIYTYNGKGLLKSYNEYHGKTKAVHNKFKYKYDKKGRIKYVYRNRGYGSGYKDRLVITYGKSKGSQKECRWLLNEDPRCITEFWGRAGWYTE